MTNANLHEAIYSGDLSRPALVIPGGDTLTYRDLGGAAAAMSISLARRGVSKGDRISFLMEKSPLVVMLAHACLRLGAILHPLNTSYTDAEIEGLIADAEPRLLVGETKDASRLSAITAKGPTHFVTIEDLCVPVPGAAPAVAHLLPEDVAAILYTSGTTGRPKGAMITHENLTENARALGQVWQLGQSDVLLHALPVFHAHGLLTALNSLFLARGAVIFLPRFEASEVIAALPGATVMMGVPTFYARLLKEPDIAKAMQHMRVLISGSAPLPLELAAEFQRMTGKTLIERYGSTEAAIITAVPPESRDRRGWVGWPLPGIELRLLQDDKSRLEKGIGVLETRGHNVFRGYWRNAAADADALAFDAPGTRPWFNTGDIAEIDAAGCVRLLGREKDLIITGGLNVYPKEVETVLDALDGIETSAVFGVGHPDFGEAVVAAVELKPGCSLDETSAIAGARSKLAAYKTPKRVVAVDEIPRNRMGKVDKKILRTTFQALFQTA